MKRTLAINDIAPRSIALERQQMQRIAGGQTSLPLCPAMPALPKLDIGTWSWSWTTPSIAPVPSNPNIQPYEQHEPKVTPL
jgi:hypothetical protein